MICRELVMWLFTNHAIRMFANSRGHQQVLKSSWYGGVADLPSNPAAEEADDGMIYRYGGFADKGKVVRSSYA